MLGSLGSRQRSQTEEDPAQARCDHRSELKVLESYTSHEVAQAKSISNGVQ